MTENFPLKNYAQFFFSEFMEFFAALATLHRKLRGTAAFETRSRLASLGEKPGSCQRRFFGLGAH